MPVRGGECSFSAWIRHLFHARAHRGHRPYFIDHQHGGNTGSTPWGCPGYCRGGSDAARFHCSIGHRVDYPIGREERSVWILPCVPASKPVAPHRWSRLPVICEARRRTTVSEDPSSCSAFALVVRETLLGVCVLQATSTVRIIHQIQLVLLRVRKPSGCGQPLRRYVQSR